MTKLHAVGWIALSTLLISGSACLIYWKRESRCDPTPIKIIVQTGPRREAVQTSYLAQLLGLSVDKPVPTGEFDCEKASTALLACPIVKEARVELLRSGILYVDYTVRQPIALLADYENTALDAEGRAFPLSPFFAPKNLPEIYLGLDGPLDWNVPLKGKAFDLACSLMRILQTSSIPELFFVKRIDVSHAEEKSLGKREIVLVAEDVIAKKEGRWIFPRYIRLSAKDYEQALGNFFELRSKLIASEATCLPPLRQGQTLQYCPLKIVDLRLPKMAFIDK